MIKEKKNRRIRTASRGPSSSPVPSNPPRRSGRRGGSIRTGELRGAEPQINQKLPGAGPVAPARRPHSGTRRHAVASCSRRVAAPACPGRPVRRSAPPCLPKPALPFHPRRRHHPARRPSPIHHVRRPSRRSPVASCHTNLPTFRTINFGDVAASVFRSYHI